MQPVEIRKGIYWVGAIDWGIRSFHGYSTPRGTTYNAYLIRDKKTVLVDTVKSCKCDEMLARIRKVVDPAEIDIIVTNHVEMDHSGSLPRLSELCPSAEIVASAQGLKGLNEHFDLGSKVRAVKTGDKINIGRADLNFLLLPMLHWPDSMATYLPGEKFLFSNDAFGQHIASSERFDDELHSGILIEEAAKYYANIVMPFSKQVRKALEVLSDIQPKVIAPSHGIIWRDDTKGIADLYDKWSSGSYDRKVVVVYDTMWGSTEKMAVSVSDVFEEKGFSVIMRDLRTSHISDVITDVLTAEYVLVGSPTLNRNVMPNISAFLTYMKGLCPLKKKSFAFGSYGWSGESVKEIEKVLGDCGFDVLPGKRIKYCPNEDEDLFLKKELAEEIAF